MRAARGEFPRNFVNLKLIYQSKKQQKLCTHPSGELYTFLFVSPGEMSTKTVLDREQQSSYQLVVLVQDGGSPPRSATGTAFITVLDDNDNDPVFTHSLSGKNLILQVTT